MDWNPNNIVAITGAIVTLIASLTSAICSVIRVLQGPTSAQVEENTRLTRHNCDVNTVAIAHAEAAAANAIIATTTAANTAARVESVVSKINGHGH